MRIVILISLVVAGISAIPVLETKVRFDNYSVYRFVPKTEAEVEILNSLETSFPGIKYWKQSGKIGRPTDVMVPPHLKVELLAGLRDTTTMQIEEPWIENVQKLIDEEEAQNILGQANSPMRIGWTAYYGYQDISNWMDEQARLHPNVASVQTFGTSFENRALKLIKISTGGNNQKPVIWLDANIHAREWITNAVATYVINELLNGQASGIKSLLDTFDFHIAPVLNPDGYEYTRSTNRMWRKTRSNYAGGTCRGADPNRNFAFRWNTGGSSSQCSSDTYMGVRAFSEPETKATSDYLTSLGRRTVAYVSLHSYSQLILIPYGTNVNGTPRIPDHAEHMRVGNLMASAIARRYNTRFQPGNIVELLYVASGGSCDWQKGVLGTKLVYTYELRDTGRYGFLLPPDQIIPSSLEFIDGLRALADDLKRQL